MIPRNLGNVSSPVIVQPLHDRSRPVQTSTVVASMICNVMYFIDWVLGTQNSTDNI